MARFAHYRTRSMLCFGTTIVMVSSYIRTTIGTLASYNNSRVARQYIYIYILGRFCGISARFHYLYRPVGAVGQHLMALVGKSVGESTPDGHTQWTCRLKPGEGLISPFPPERVPPKKRKKKYQHPAFQDASHEYRKPISRESRHLRETTIVTISPTNN